MPRGERLNNILSRSHSVSALLALLERPHRMTELNDAMGGYGGNSKILTEILEEAGWIIIHREKGPFGKTQYSIELTDLGRELAKLADKMAQLYPDVEANVKPKKRKTSR